MMVVELRGGAGNQLFQYALGRLLAQKRQTELLLDAGLLQNRATGSRPSAARAFALDWFGLQPAFASAAITKRYGLRPTRWQRLAHRLSSPLRPPGPLTYLAEQTPFRFDARIGSAPDNSYLSGYWQSLRYVEPVAAQLRRELRFREALPAHSATLARLIAENESVCVHVRRGDFVGSTRHGILDRSYYYRAEENFRQQYNDALFFVFSDDPDWCRKNLHLGRSVVYVGQEHAGVDGRFHLQLMTLCRHFIIANSTFSWWAAFLGQRPDSRVIVPRVWLRHAGKDQTASELKFPHWLEL